MLRRLHLRTCFGVLAVLSAAASAAERPTSEALRAAAAAVRNGVVDIEVVGPVAQPFGRMQPQNPFVIPQPEQPDGRQWRFEFQVPPQGGPQPNNEDMQRFFRNLNPGQVLLGGRRTGLGVVVRAADGRALVAVPYDLAAAANEIHVKTAAGQRLEAKRLGADRVTGLACLEVKDDTLKAVAAAPEAPKQGDWVLGVGGPESGGALSIGIVSAVDRPGMHGATVFLTDTLVPNGMDGMALLDLEGRLLGTALPSRNGEFTQAVPAAAVGATIDALARDGRVRRGFLGIMLAPVSPEIRQQLQIDHGVLAQKVMEGHAAEKAGLQDGDVILELDGRRIESPMALMAMLNAKQPKEAVALKVLRGREALDIQVTLGERPEERALQPAGRPRIEEGTKLDIGLSVTPVTPELAAMHKLGNDKGLVVTHVAANGPADKARPKPVRPGELLGEVGKKPVTTVDEAKTAIAEARQKNEKNLLLLVRGSEGTRYVVIDLKPQPRGD